MLLINRIGEKMMTGYDLTKSINTGHSHQQVYRELRALEKKGVLYKKVVQQEGKPDKVLYYSSVSIDPIVESFDDIKSDFTKTNAAYIVDQINCNDNSHSSYVEHMRNAEIEFIKKMGLVPND